MQTKILLFLLSTAVFSSCSTAYKSGQTPDDVYYSPARAVEEDQDNDREEVKSEPAKDYSITMAARDYRWREFRDDYSYDNSPYNYTCKNYNYGYYYNPYYYPWVIYTGKSYKPVNTTPRMVNLNSYKGYNSNIATGKYISPGSSRPASQYNNSNSRVGNLMREILSPSSSSSGSSNNTRTYSPPASNSSSGSSGSSRSSNSGSSVSRPGRG